MIKNIFTSKIVSAASGECFVIGVKLADTEAHAIRFLGFALLLTSAIVMFREWQHKAHAETVVVPAKAARRARKPSRSRAAR